MSSTQKLDVTDTPINETFIANRSKSIMFVPPYQREYSWNEDNISDFWFDNINTDDASINFLGSILVHQSSNKKKRGTVEEFEIIDGQQRITTITLILCAIRDYAKEASERLKEKEGVTLLSRLYMQIDDSLTAQTGITADKKIYKLRIGSQNRDFFESKILNIDYKLDQKKDSYKVNKIVKRMINNYFYIRNDLIEDFTNIKSTKNTPQKLAVALEKLTEIVYSIIIIEIKSYEKDNAIDIFQTINDRGADLEKADLIKAKVFEKITKRKEDTEEGLDKRWNDMVENIQEIDRSSVKIGLSKFIRYFWMSKYKFVTMSQLVRNFDKKIKPAVASEFLNELVEYSEILKDLTCVGREDFLAKYNIDKNHYVFDSLVGIRLQQNIQSMVLLMSYIKSIKRFKNKKFDYNLFESVDNFTFSYFTVCHKRANRVEQLYSKFALKISNSNSANEVRDSIGDFILNLKKISPSEAEFNEEFSRSLNYKKRKFCSYLLARLERVGTTGEHLINFEQVNMDHILPQNSLRSKKGKMSNKDYVNDEERLNSIGNLVLVHKKINSSKGDKGIRAGIDTILEYKDEGTSIKTTRVLAEKIKKNGYDWSYSEIAERTNELCSQAFKLTDLD
mgnify:CR=1 FL=1